MIRYTLKRIIYTLIRLTFLLVLLSDYFTDNNEVVFYQDTRAGERPLLYGAGALSSFQTTHNYMYVIINL